MSATDVLHDSNRPGASFNDSPRAVQDASTSQKRTLDNVPGAPLTSGIANETNDVGSSNAKVVSKLTPEESADLVDRPPAKRRRPQEGPEAQDEFFDSLVSAILGKDWEVDNENQSTRSAEDPARPSKKQRIEPDDVQPDLLANPDSQTPLFQLPLELLAEILVLTGSPEYILAFARTCKRFCHILLGEDAQFIWRASRQGPGCSFKALPGPPASVFSEAAYAAFVFDRGNCEVCGSMTNKPYISFALRLKLCGKASCREWRHMFKELNTTIYHRIKSIVPVNEAELPPNYGHGVFFWPNTTEQYGRVSEVEEACEEYCTKKDSEEHSKKFESLKKRNEEWMQFCVRLSKWQTVRNARFDEVKAANKEFAQRVSGAYGWNHEFLMESTFGPYLLKKTKLLELITLADVSRMRDQIEVELLELQGKHERRRKEISLMENRKDVGHLYNSLRSKKAYESLPSLPTFRQLPVVSVLQAGRHQGKQEKRIMNTLQGNALMENLLDQQIHQWAEAAKQDLAVLLGYPKDWKTVSNLDLHPVERVTAWFLCVKCKSVEKKYRMDGCLDFAGACAHICRNKNGRNDKGKKAIWNPTKFIKDDKAFNVVMQCLQVLGFTEQTKSGNNLRESGRTAVCKSCDPPILLEWKSIIGHCHRHEDMQVAFYYSVNDMAGFLAGFPYESGLVERLLLGSGESTKKEIAAKNFGCRHCLAKLRSPPKIGDSSASNGLGGTYLSHVEQRTRELYPLASQEKFVLFDFNGLRSHLKGKHQLQDVRDEDVFRTKHKEVQ